MNDHEPESYLWPYGTRFRGCRVADLPDWYIGWIIREGKGGPDLQARASAERSRRRLVRLQAEEVEAARLAGLPRQVLLEACGRCSTLVAPGERCCRCGEPGRPVAATPRRRRR